MELIIDRDFLDDFYLKYEEANIYHVDIRDFLKKATDFKLITNYNSIEELQKEAEESNPILHELFETTVPEIEFRENLYEDIQVEHFHESGSPFKLFFIENNSSSTSYKFGYETISTDNLETKWKPFLHGRSYEKNVLKTTKNKSLERSERLERWEDISIYSHNSHSIIIADRFVLDSLYDNKRTIEKNLFPLLKQLIGEERNNTPIDLMIITRKGDIKNMYDKIDKFLKQTLQIPNYHFSLIVEPPNLRFEHFRRIFTNYFQIKVENSLNVFKDNNSYNDKNNDFTFNFIFNPRNYRFARKELEDIKSYVQQVRNREKVDNDTEKTYYLPDKKNTLLDRI